MSPTIYLDGAYRLFTDGYSMDVIVGKLYEGIMDSENSGIQFDAEKFKDFQQIKDHIIYRLINAAKNKDLLKNVPHISYLDLAICFAAYYEQADGTAYSVMVHENHAKMWGVTAEQLYEYAEKNSPVLNPTKFVPMSSLLGGLADGCKMYVLTNKQKCLGAASVLYSEELKEFSDKCQADLIMIPSSVHEWIVFPRSGFDSVDRILEMIEEVNRSCVDPEEVLSYRIYIYRAEIGQVRIAA